MNEELDALFVEWLLLFGGDAISFDNSNDSNKYWAAALDKLGDTEAFNLLCVRVIRQRHDADEYTLPNGRYSLQKEFITQIRQSDAWKERHRGT